MTVPDSTDIIIAGNAEKAFEVRYADDIVLCFKSKEDALRIEKEGTNKESDRAHSISWDSRTSGRSQGKEEQ